MDQREVSAAIDKLCAAVSPTGQVYVRTTMPEKQDVPVAEICHITASRNGFLNLGYRFIRAADESCENPIAKLNSLIETDSEVFFTLELLEESIDDVLSKAVAPKHKPSLLESVIRLAAWLAICLMIYAIVNYLITG